MGNTDLKVITDAIRADVVMWDEQAIAIGEVGAAIKGMQPTRLEFGLFQLIFGDYSDVIDHLSSRCAEGNAEMSKIADELLRNAKAYDDHEVETEKSVENAY
ncbi:hypothetical protein [Streptomyces sp. NPDC088246]|uniref:hypothetical protein n=1 Tax=Streptomyces sp. NPDC088246 TaxID=3365842 RepID=UPI00382C1535